MKIVGIVCRTNKDSDNSNEFSCLESYVRVFTRYNDIIPIMILPPKNLVYNDTKSSEECITQNEQSSKLNAVLDICSGFIVPGGDKWYSHDEYIIQYAIDHDKPLLGICLGMQIMGVMDNRLNSGIFDNTILNYTKINHKQNDVSYVHDVSIVENTLLSDILKKDTIKVNSRHNYHIDGVVNLIISAVSEDGLIEAIEYPNRKFILGVQWHPESLIEFDLSSQKIFDQFHDSL